MVKSISTFSTPEIYVHPFIKLLFKKKNTCDNGTDQSSHKQLLGQMERYGASFYYIFELGGLKRANVRVKFNFDHFSLS